MKNELFDPRHWLLSGPLVILISVLLALRLRRVALSLPALLVAVGCLFWILVLLALPYNLVGFGLSRTFATVAVLAAACMPLLLEAYARQARAIPPWSKKKAPESEAF